MSRWRKSLTVVMPVRSAITAAAPNWSVPRAVVSPQDAGSG
jgi:hypothetical protein